MNRPSSSTPEPSPRQRAVRFASQLGWVVVRSVVQNAVRFYVRSYVWENLPDLLHFLSQL